MTANKCTKKRGARAVVVLAIQTYCCFDNLVVVAVVACLHGGGGTQVGGVTRQGEVTRLTACDLYFDHLYMIGGVTRRGFPHLHVNMPFKSLNISTGAEGTPIYFR